MRIVLEKFVDDVDELVSPALRAKTERVAQVRERKILPDDDREAIDLWRRRKRSLGGDDSVWEQEPLRRLARDHQLGSFRHDGFWHPMDTLRDRNELESLWESGVAPWRCW